MKRLYILVILTLCVTNLCAQIQKGYVRTVGRPNNPQGTRLPDVKITVRGLHAIIKSGTNGNFEINLGGGKTTYQLTSIMLDGYELQRKEDLQESRNVGLNEHVIVLVSKSEKNAIYKKVSANLEQKYKARITKWESELKSNKITTAQYLAQKQQLEEAHENMAKMADEMTERYSNTDYAVLNETEALINSYIEDGDLERADSVINTLNVAKLEADRQSVLNNIDDIKQKLAKEKQAIEIIDSTLNVACRIDGSIKATKQRITESETSEELSSKIVDKKPQPLNEGVKNDD